MWIPIAAALAADPLEDHGRRLLERQAYGQALAQFDEAGCGETTCAQARTQAADGFVRETLVGDARHVLTRSAGIQASGLPYSPAVADELALAKERAVAELAERQAISGLLNDRERLGLSDASVQVVLEALAALPRDPLNAQRVMLETRETDALYGDVVATLDTWFLHQVGETAGAGTGSERPAETRVEVRVDVGRCAMLKPWDQDRTSDPWDVEVKLTGRCGTQVVRTQSPATDEDGSTYEVTRVEVRRTVGGTLVARWDGGVETSPITVQQVTTTVAYQTRTENVVLDVDAAEAQSLEETWQTVERVARALAKGAAQERGGRFLDEARTLDEAGDREQALARATSAWLLRQGEDEVAFIADRIDAEVSWVRTVLQGVEVERPEGPSVHVPDLPAAPLYRGADGKLAGPGLEELSWLERRR